MYDIVALGELLIDFTPEEKAETGTILFRQNPGGAPANVLAGLAKLGKKAAFIGKVGMDQFGVFLAEILTNHGIDTTGLKYCREVNTTLAFVHLNEKGERSFCFYRNPGADMMLSEEEVDYDLIKQSTIFHFGSLSMTHEPSKTATLKAVQYAKNNGLLISYDPNLRKPLWRDLHEAKSTILQGLPYTDILKVTEEELEFLTGKGIEEGSRIIHDQYKIPLIFVTLGAKGCYYRCRNQGGQVEGFKVNTIDSTGAGDAFLAAVLFQILEKKKLIKQLVIQEIEEIVAFANAMGALSTTKKGAIPAMPSKGEVDKLLMLEYTRSKDERTRS